MNDIRFAMVLHVTATLTMFLLYGHTLERDMKVCRLTYSHDTCFSALNR